MNNKNNIQPPQRFKPPTLREDQDGNVCYVYDVASYGNKNRRNSRLGANSQTKPAPRSAGKPTAPPKRAAESW